MATHLENSLSKFTCVTHDSTVICSIFIAESNMAYIAYYKFKMAA